MDEKQTAAEVTVKNRPSNPAKTRASTRAEASSSSRASASASASATVSGDGQADCTTEATATAESDGERITAHQVRRFRGAQGGCNSSARATTEGARRRSSRE